MNRTICMKLAKRLALGLAALAIAATPSFAQDNLVALEATATMPDGAVIPMWGFFEDIGQLCTDVPVWEVGPTLTASPAGTLAVNLRNCLSEPVSVFIPGQLKAMTPVWTDGTSGPRGTDLTKRVRSFDAETAPNAVGSYEWTGVKEGTYLYHSGTHPQVQVQMGLYGALTVGNYGVANEATLVYSEIDPDLHAAVDGGTYGTTGPTSTFDYKPRYFLINGAAYPGGVDIPVETITDVLLRFVNAGLKTRVPTLDGGLYMSLIAEDGNLYPFPIEQYGVELQAAKTIDAIVNAGTAGSYALYDRALGLTNWLETGGGMLTYIAAGAAVGAPTAVVDAYSTAEDVPLSVAILGVLGNDLDADGINPIPATYTASLVSDVSAGVLALAADGSFTYTPDLNFNGTDLFSYQAVDTAAGPNSNVATVTITVTPVNNPPVANDDSATTPPNAPVTVDVVTNDTDVDDNLDPTTATITVAATSGTAVSNLDGTITYTPNLGFSGPDTFDYQVCDTGDDGLGTNALCDTATVTISVVNNAPVANDDPATTPANTAAIIDVVANDTDVDGNLDPTSVTVAAPPTNGAAVSNGDGTVTYTPGLDFVGTDTFVYQVCDTASACDSATVTITVASDPPVANDDFATTTRNNAVNINVILNDTDADGIDPTTVSITTALTQRGGTAVANLDGTVTYNPKRGFRGTDTFQYTVDDALGGTSNVATVRINVLK